MLFAAAIRLDYLIKEIGKAEVLSVRLVVAWSIYAQKFVCVKGVDAFATLLHDILPTFAPVNQ